MPASLTTRSRTESSALLLELERRRGRTDLLYFASQILPFPDLRPEVHGPLTAALQATTPKRLVLLPRGTFKSTLCSIAYPLWRLLRQPNLRILIDADTRQSAVKYLDAIKTICETHDKFRTLYGNLRRGAPRWTEDELTLAGRTGFVKEPSITAGSTEIVKVGMHYDLIVCDDLVNEQNVVTADQRQKVLQHYRLLLSLLEPDGELVIVGTRWHFDDLYGWLLEHDPEYTVLLESATRPDGSLFFPQRLSRTFLDRMESIQGSAIYACQYQNSPRSIRDPAFQPAWCGLTAEPIPPGFVSMTIDPAISSRPSADYTGVVTCSSSPGRMHVLRAQRLKGTLGVVVDAILELIDKDHPTVVGFEDVGFQQTFRYTLQERALARGKAVPIVTLKPLARNKEKRIMALQPWLEFGKLRLGSACSDLREELLDFPNGRHDDLIDSLAYQLDLVGTGPLQGAAETPPPALETAGVRRRRPAEIGDADMGTEW